MIETTPKGHFVSSWDFTEVLDNIKERSNKIQSVLGKNEFIITIPVFPTLGVGDYYKL